MLAKGGLPAFCQCLAHAMQPDWRWRQKQVLLRSPLRDMPVRKQGDQ
ncbi:hypothetical protein ApDm4_2320 [Acetobacter pomorum]|nr:hypothetical protein ApDm4_2320 [Acetobacter pomorum]